MQRAATILLVLYSSFMLGKAPCCRIHEFAGSVPSEVMRSIDTDEHARGPGQYVCPCCEKPGKHENGQPAPHFGKACTCPTLIGTIAADSDAIDLPLALPFDGSFLPAKIDTLSVFAFVQSTLAPPIAVRALTLPLLL